MLANAGAACFGAVLGYITYRMLIRTTENATISDLTTVVGTVGGGVVTTLIDPRTELFGWYGVGLAIGFVIYGVGFLTLNGWPRFARTMGATGEKPESGSKQRPEGPLSGGG